MATNISVSIDPRTGLEELGRDDCLQFLARAPLGRLGVVVGGRPLVFPVNFTLDGDAVILRTDEGTKLHAARNGPVAFECDGIDRLYHTGWSVLVRGVAKEVTGFPMAAFNVSGEYAMVKAAAANGWLDERQATLEVLTAIRRATLSTWKA